MLLASKRQQEKEGEGAARERSCSSSVKHLECDNCQDVQPSLSRVGWDGGGVGGADLEQKMLRSAKWRKRHHLSQTEKSTRCGRPSRVGAPSRLFAEFIFIFSAHVPVLGRRQSV